MSLWLDAYDPATIILSGSTVSQWSDKSGKSNHAVQATASAQPAYQAAGMSTSTPAVSLDGSNDFLTASIAGIQAMNALDVFMVVQTTAAAAADTNTGIFWGFGNGSAASGPYPASRLVALASLTGSLSGETVSSYFESASFSTGRLGSSSYTRAANTAQILHSSNSTAGTSLRTNESVASLNLANQITTATNTAPVATGYTVDNDFHIGALRSNGTIVVSPALKYSEIIVLPAVASAEMRQRILGYLAWKPTFFGGTAALVAALPADHPYKSSPPRL